MNSNYRTNRIYLEDILFSIQRIEEYIDNHSYTTFVSDQKTIDAVIRNFEIIGEASKNIDSNIKEKYNELPWDEMYYLRNKVSHAYFGIDYEIIWDIAINHLPLNKIQIEVMLSEKSIT